MPASLSELIRFVEVVAVLGTAFYFAGGLRSDVRALGRSFDRFREELGRSFDRIRDEIRRGHDDHEERLRELEETRRPAGGRT